MRIAAQFDLEDRYAAFLHRLAEWLEWPTDRVIQAAVEYALEGRHAFVHYLNTGKRLETEYCLNKKQIERIFGEPLTRHLARRLRELGFRPARRKLFGRIVRVWVKSRTPELQGIIDNYLRRSGYAPGASGRE